MTDNSNYIPSSDSQNEYSSDEVVEMGGVRNPETRNPETQNPEVEIPKIIIPKNHNPEKS